MFKDVKINSWSFDFKQAEKLRFKGACVWDPSRVSEQDLRQYFNALKQLGSDASEEVALKYLAMHDFSVQEALREAVQSTNNLEALRRDSLM